METPASIFAYLLFGLKNKEWIENGQKIPGFVIGELSEEWKSTSMEKLFKHTENLFFTKTTSQNQRKCLIMSVMVKFGE